MRELATGSTARCALLSGALVLAWLLPAASAEALTAEVEANGQSFYVGPATSNAGFTISFTSWDGSPSTPLQDCFAGSCLFSGELSRDAGVASYRADYLAADDLGPFEHGSVTLTLSSTDADADGLVDALERALPGSFAFSGTAVPAWNVFGVYVNSTLTGSVSRGAGEDTGSYAGSFTNQGGAAMLAGEMALSTVSGTVSYEAGGDTLTWSLTRRGIGGAAAQLDGSSSWVARGTDAIEIPAFVLTDGAEGAVSFEAAVLVRDGYVFRGTLVADDGEPATSWSDYTHFAVELNDENDSNFDGLPDLLLPEPRAELAGVAVVATLLALRGRRGLRLAPMAVCLRAGFRAVGT